jgi:hypothetical protein
MTAPNAVFYLLTCFETKYFAVLKMRAATSKGESFKFRPRSWAQVLTTASRREEK